MNDIKMALNLFVSIDQNRKDLCQYFKYKDWLMATNGYAAIRMPESLIPGVEEYKGKIDFGKAWPNHLLNYRLVCSVEDFKTQMDKMEHEEEYKNTNPAPCGECSGNADVTWKYTDKNGIDYWEDYECPVCSGRGTVGFNRKTGRFIPSAFERMAIRHCHISGKNAYTLYQLAQVLGETEIALIHITESDKPMVFRIGMAEVLVMPYYLTDYNMDDAKAKPLFIGK